MSTIDLTELRGELAPDELLSALLGVTGGSSSRHSGTLLDAKAHEIVTSIEPPGDRRNTAGAMITGLR